MLYRRKKTQIDFSFSYYYSESYTRVLCKRLLEYYYDMRMRVPIYLAGNSIWRNTKTKIVLSYYAAAARARRRRHVLPPPLPLLRAVYKGEKE